MNIVKVILLCASLTLGDATASHCLVPHPIAVARPDSGRKFDEYGNLSFKDEKARLDNLAAQLKTEPRSKGYIFVHDGNKGNIRTLKSRACRALHYLVSSQGVDPKRIVALAGIIKNDSEEDLTVELWMWPFEALDDLPRFGRLNENEAITIKGIDAKAKCGQALKKATQKK